MDDIELKNIQLQFPNARTLSRDDSSVVEERVETGRGSVLVAVQGNRSKPAILTYHDLGLNCKYEYLRLKYGNCQYQYNETNVMHYSFSVLRIKDLYMFRALLAHPQ
jgi:hypothetical protein